MNVRDKLGIHACCDHDHLNNSSIAKRCIDKNEQVLPFGGVALVIAIAQIITIAMIIFVESIFSDCCSTTVDGFVNRWSDEECLWFRSWNLKFIYLLSG